MAFGDAPSDKELRAGWDDFCERLKEAAPIIFDNPAPATLPARLDGIRYLSQIISLGLDLELEHNDPLHPQLFRYFGPTRKQGGDNPDSVYLGSRIDGSKTYRVVGNFGNVHYVVFTTLTRNSDVAGGHAFYGFRDGMLFGKEIRTEWDGSFELLLSPHEHKGNWLQTSPEATWFTIRQFYGDWENDQAINVRIELVGEQPPPSVLTADRLAAALRAAGSFVGESAKFWQQFTENGRPGLGKTYDRANVFYSSQSRPRKGGMDGVPGSTGGAGCWWQVQPDEALIIEFTPPKSHLFWNFEFSNYWLISNDYRYRVCSLNDRQAICEDDGSVRVIVAHRDPGVPNWLDCAGHTEGRIGTRWMFADAVPTLKTRLVKFVDLSTLLLPNAKRMTPEERREQLRHRLIGVNRRFRP